MSEQLTFISPAIIERIENGSFVPSRRSHSGLQMSDRRDILSPLAVTKRCIRYEPHVFQDRQATILKIARALNVTGQKITLVGGQQGSGKTSLVRAVIELMGSQDEQLLWFDVNRHTDFEEIIQFLIQYITYVCSARDTADSGNASPISGPAQEEPLRKLETLIKRVGHMPLLIVLDNVEFIVDTELRFNSFPFKEMLNFLLGFPNIKMVLIGERLPYADMSPNQEGITDIRLEGLTEQGTQQFLESRKKPNPQTAPDPAILELAAAPEAELAAIRHLYDKTQGYPWLLKILFYLNHQANLDFYTMNRLLESEADAGKTLPVLAFVRYIYQRLPDQHRRLIQVLAFLRHPVNAKTLLALVSVCYPVLGPSGLDRQALEDMLEHSLMKGLLKITYPPQEVLAHIRNRKQQQADDGKEKKFKAWYELYHAVKLIIYGNLPQEERERIHKILQDFYLREKGQDSSERILRIKNRALLVEAKYHGSVSRERKAGLPAIQLGHTETMLEEAPIFSKAYLSRNIKPVPNPQRLTLNDYRNINLPDSASSESILGESAEANQAGPAFRELLESSAGKLSFQEQLAEIELTEEEKAILFQKESEMTLHLAAQSSVSHSAESAPTESMVPPSPESSTPAAENQDLQHLLTDVHEDEQEKLIQQRLTAAVVSQDKPAMVKELVALAQYRANHGRYESAGHCLEKALNFKADASREILAEIYRLSGSVNKKTYHHNTALAALSKAAVAIRQLMYEDDTVNASWMSHLGQVYQDLGEIHAYRKQYDDAIAHFNLALRWYTSADKESHQAEVYFQLAGVYDDLKQVEESIAHYQKALTLDEKNGNQLSAAASLANLGNLYRDEGRWTEAIDCFNRSLVYDRATGHLEGQFTTLDSLATICMLQEALLNAENIARQGLAQALQKDSGIWKASFYMKLGQIYELQQEWGKALNHFQLAYSSGTQDLSKQSLRWIQEKIEEAKSTLAES